MDLIEQLNKERSVLIENVKAIDTLLAFYGASRDFTKDFNNVLSYNYGSTDDNVFPVAATKEKQIMWLFEKKFTQIVKISEIKDLHKKYSGNDDRIDNTARRMKREGKLILVKYNDNNILSFWGLPTWLDNNGVLLDQYSPDFGKLPEIESVDIIRK